MMVTSELTGEVSMGVLLVFLVFWRRGCYIGLDQQGDNLPYLKSHLKHKPRGASPRRDYEDGISTNRII